MLKETAVEVWNGQSTRGKARQFHIKYMELKSQAHKQQLPYLEEVYQKGLKEDGYGNIFALYDDYIMWGIAIFIVIRIALGK